MMMNCTDSFINDIDRVFNEPVPPKVLKRAKYAFLDYLCVTLAGAEYNRKKTEKYIKLLDTDGGRFKVLGFDETASLTDAVFINGLSAHSLDYDDGTNAGIIHLGAPIFSALISICEKYDIDNELFYKSVIAGYEASFSIAYSIQPIHKNRGYHATGTCGVIGATLALCYALGYDEKEKKNALSTAVMASSGMLKVLDEGSELKPFNVAKTAMLSVISAQMAKSGFLGPEDPFGGYRGFFSMMVGDENQTLYKPLSEGIYAIERAYVKPYAACRYCHPAIECAVGLREDLLKDGIDTDRITKTDIKTYKLAVSGHDHKDIINVASAKMSIPFSVAVALTFGKAGLREYSADVITSDTVRKIIGTVTVEDDELISTEFPQKQIAEVKLSVGDRIYSRRVEFPKGEPENPLTDSEFLDRFRDMCRYAGKEDNLIEKVYEAVAAEDIKIRDIIKML